MTKFIFILFSVIIISSCTAHKKQEKKTQITYETYEVKDGWGYKILINDKAFIDQDRIPDVSGKKPFTCEEDAEKVAKRVIDHLKNKRRPDITKEDLEELDIQYQN